MKILIIEDNDVLRENIKAFLEIQKCSVDTHSQYEGAAYKILNNHYDAVILDLGLGSEIGDGLTICEEVRREGGRTPILILTARMMTEQKIEGLQAGADDYIVKPFDYHELFARIQAVVRRDAVHKSKIISFENSGKNIEINEGTMSVSVDGEVIDLSKMEFKLLVFLARNQWKVLSKEIIMERVWGEVDLFRESRSVDIYVWYLRKKFSQNLIETIRGVGYMIP